MKKILKIILLVILLIGTVYLLVSANNMAGDQRLNSPTIELNVQDGISLLTEQELLNELYTHHLFSEQIKKSDFNPFAVESYLENMNEVLTADVFVGLGNDWNIDVTTRRPIARIVVKGMKSFYIDSNYDLMKLSPYSKPRILMFTGMDDFYNPEMAFEKIINNDSLKTKLMLDQIYHISKYVCSDAFYNAQIVQVHYDKKEGFILIPKVGDQRIIFGAAKTVEEVNDKFQKLTTFYGEVVPYEGWNKYKSINLKFKDQIVAKKK